MDPNEGIADDEEEADFAIQQESSKKNLSYKRDLRIDIPKIKTKRAWIWNYKMRHESHVIKFLLNYDFMTDLDLCH